MRIIIEIDDQGKASTTSDSSDNVVIDGAAEEVAGVAPEFPDPSSGADSYIETADEVDDASDDGPDAAASDDQGSFVGAGPAGIVPEPEFGDGDLGDDDPEFSDDDLLDFEGGGDQLTSMASSDDGDAEDAGGGPAMGDDDADDASEDPFIEMTQEEPLEGGLDDDAFDEITDSTPPDDES